MKASATHAVPHSWMRLLRLAAALTLLASSATLAACADSSDGTSQQSSATPESTPQPIASGTFSGERTEAIDLGVQQLENTVWVHWVLKGPWNARAWFSMRLVKPNGEFYGSVSHGPVSYGGVSSIEGTGLVMTDIEPGLYHVYVREKVRPEVSRGYAAKIGLLTSPEKLE